MGGALGWLAGIGALAIPGLGSFIAAGLIMTKRAKEIFESSGAKDISTAGEVAVAESHRP
jgi:hypothetical protein